MMITASIIITQSRAIRLDWTNELYSGHMKQYGGSTARATHLHFSKPNIIWPKISLFVAVVSLLAY